jgi:hypothetical protein
MLSDALTTRLDLIHLNYIRLHMWEKITLCLIKLIHLCNLTVSQTCAVCSLI